WTFARSGRADGSAALSDDKAVYAILPARGDQERFGRKARLPAARGFWLPASNSGADDIRSSQSQVTGVVSWSGSQINS
ncbi:hypothetical protein WAH63_22695, partial [Acinetobacter baumannii]